MRTPYAPASGLRAALLASCLLLGPASMARADVTVAFDQTFPAGATAPWPAPPGVYAIDVVATGGWGFGETGAPGGRPARIDARLAVTPGSTLFLRVAGNGTTSGGGANGGGNTRGANAGGGGGGASDVRTDPADAFGRLLSAAGGGGGGSPSTGSGTPGRTGGAGGGDAGLNGLNAPSAQFTTETAGFGGAAAAFGAIGTGGAGGEPIAEGSAGDEGGDGSLGTGGPGGAGGDDVGGAGGGGGGGAGLLGGGGGGGGAVLVGGAFVVLTGGGGGGGGFSLVPDGATVAVVEEAEGTPSIRIRYTSPGTEIAGATGATADATPVFTLTATEPGATFECRLDSSDADAWIACPAAYAAPALGDGPHVLEARAANAMGNVDATPASAAFSVDTLAPVTTVTGGPDGSTADARPTFSFTADDPAATFACSLDGGPFGPCSGAGRHQPSTPLGEGPHAFAVRATDAAGNTGSGAGRTFGVDAAPVMSQLRLSRTTVKRSARAAKRRVAARFALDQPAAVTLTLKRKGRRVVRKTVPLAAGEQAVGFKVKARARTGRYKVRILARDATGNASVPLAAVLRVER